MTFALRVSLVSLLLISKAFSATISPLRSDLFYEKEQKSISLLYKDDISLYLNLSTKNLLSQFAIKKNLIEYNWHVLKLELINKRIHEKTIVVDNLEFLFNKIENKNLSIALSFLPSPSAKKYIKQKALTFFDKGDLQSFLYLSDFIEIDEFQKQKAKELLKRNKPFKNPGIPVLTNIETKIKQTNFFTQKDNFLIAYYPSGFIKWQYRLPNKSKVYYNHDAALISSGTKLELINREGEIQKLPPKPYNIKILSCEGTHAWFSLGKTVYRYENGKYPKITLPEEPISSPLEYKKQTMWLTKNQILLYYEKELKASFKHNLKFSNKAKLRLFQQNAMIIDNEKYYKIRDFSLEGNSIERAKLLLRAGKIKEAIENFNMSEETEKQKNKLVALEILLKGGEELITKNLALIKLFKDTNNELKLSHLLKEKSNRYKELLNKFPNLHLPLSTSDKAWQSSNTWKNTITAFGISKLNSNQEPVFETEISNDMYNTTITAKIENKIIWITKISGKQYSPSRKTFYDKDLFLVSGESKLHIINSKTGEEIANFTIRSTEASFATKITNKANQIEIHWSNGLKQFVSQYEKNGKRTSLTEQTN